MGFILEYFNKNKREEEKQLNKLFDNDVFNIDLDAINESKYSKFFYTKDKADEIILESYDKKYFLKELKKQVKPQVLDNMAKLNDSKSKNEIKEEEKKQINQKVKNIENPEELKEELDDDSQVKEETQENLNVKSEMIKSVYINTLKKYYSLVQNLQRSSDGQMKTGSIVNGSKYDNKLIMYQYYMRKLDLWYRANNHGVPIGFDEDVQEIIQDSEYKKVKNDSITNELRKKDVEKLEQINDELENLEEKMVNISNREDNTFNNTEELEKLKKEYASKKLELALLSPSVGIVHAENVQKEKNDERLNSLGINLDEKYDSRIYGQKINSKRKNEEYKIEKSTTNLDNMIHDDMISDNINKVEDAIAKFDEAMSEGRYEDAIQSISTAGVILATASDTMEISDEDMQTFEDARLEAQKLKRVEIEEERNNSMGIGAVYSDSEILAKDIAEALYSKRDKYKNEAERIKNTNERCR